MKFESALLERDTYISKLKDSFNALERRAEDLEKQQQITLFSKGLVCSSKIENDNEVAIPEPRKSKDYLKEQQLQPAGLKPHVLVILI